MQSTKDSNDSLVERRTVKETLLLSGVFLIALVLFFYTVYFIATKEVEQELQNRSRALLFGWLTTMILGLILGKTRQEEAVSLPRSLIVVRESIQAAMLLLFFGVLCYGSYYLFTVRALILQRPWGIMVGWFAFLMFLAFFAKTRQLVRIARRK